LKDPEAAAAQKVESQRLLMPLLLELTPAQQAVFAEISEELKQNGFEAEPFGARSVAIKVAPAGVEAAQIEHMLHELLDQFSREEQVAEHGKDSRAHCRVHRLPRRHQSQHAAGAK
jgi:DNA mismatch repair ATPase MutL